MRYPGVVIGIVSDVNDPTGQGRVKLKFPWLSDEHASGWAPVAAPMAGKKRGQWFMPEIGDEALVAFEHGDFEHPFVVGFLWNGADVPPDTDNQHRVVVTPGGHELRFEDNDGAKRVVLKTSAGFAAELDDAAKSITLKTPGGVSVKLTDDAGGAMTFSGGGRQIKISGGQVQIT